MSTYKFTLDGKSYYFVGDSQVKNKVANKQGVELLQKVNAEVCNRFTTDDTYSRNGLSVPHSTVLDENYNIVVRPEVTQAKSQLDEECIRYKIEDCTIVNVYKLDGKILLGTKNSWGINNSKDLYDSTTYGSAFEESLSAYGLTLDTIPEGTYGFTNPRIHLMSNKYSVFSFTRDSLVNDDGETVNVQLQLADNNDTEYFEYYPHLHLYHEVVSQGRQEACNTLYSNRNRFRDSDDKISLLNCIINFLCEARPAARKYVGINQSFNSYAMACRKYITNVVRGIDRITTDKYYGVEIPKGLMNNNIKFDRRYHTFWRLVLTNAYMNATMKSVNTF